MIVWLVPTGRAVVVRVATPVPFTVPLPRAVLPRVKATLPVGVPAVLLTVAVRVTLCPKVDVAGMAVTLVVVPALVTVSL